MIMMRIHFMLRICVFSCDPMACSPAHSSVCGISQARRLEWVAMPFSIMLGVKASLSHSCLSLCDPMDCNPPGTFIHGVLQARILECISISFSRGSSPPRDPTWVSHTAGRLFTNWDTIEAMLGWGGGVCCWVASVASDSAWPHRRQPTRLHLPWESPGKNAGVGCHFLLQYMKVKSESEVAQSCLTQWPHGPQPTRLLSPWGFPGKSTGVGLPLPSPWVGGRLG